MSLMQTLPETAALSAVGLRKTHGSGAGEVVAVDGVDLAVSAGEIVAITGRSGSGKTTLLNLLGGLDDPSEGSVHLLGESLAELSAHDLALRRRRHLGHDPTLKLRRLLRPAERSHEPKPFLAVLQGHSFAR